MRATIGHTYYEPATANLRAAWVTEVTCGDRARNAYGETEAESRDSAESTAAALEIAGTARRFARGL